MSQLLTPLETAAETRHGLELATIAYTKGQLSAGEYWAEVDWAATSYEALGLPERATDVRRRWAELRPAE